MQNYKTTLSIIIVNYRSEQYLRGCLASIFEKFKGISYEIFIVNNDENHLETSFPSDFPSEIKIIDHRKNIGFGAGINLGAKEAAGKYLLFLNPDTEILSDNFSEILEKFEKNPQVAAIGPRLITEENKTQRWCAGKEFSFWQLVKNNFGIIESKKIWESEKEIFAGWVSGGAMFIKKDVFEKTGGFDEKFFMYFEDADLCKRINKLGYKTLYCPQFEILHIGGGACKSSLRQKIQYYKSLYCYFRKWSRNIAKKQAYV